MSSALSFGVGNFYNGATLINGGSIQAGSFNAFSPRSGVILANVSGASLDLNGFNQTSNPSLAVGPRRQCDSERRCDAHRGRPECPFNISNVDTRTTFAGQITGSGNITLTGGGVLTLANNTSSYTGQTNINSGTLVIGNMGQLGAGTSPIFVNGIASVNGLPGGTLVVQGGTIGLTFIAT